jgi:hypothetical protein
MLMNLPPKYQRRRNIRFGPATTTPPTPPAAPELVMATYDDGETVTLYFNEPIDVSQLDGEQIMVEDGTYAGSSFTAIGPVQLLNPTTVRLGLVVFETSTSTDVLLDAQPSCGIRNQQGVAWAGVYDYVIEV